MNSTLQQQLDNLSAVPNMTARLPSSTVSTQRMVQQGGYVIIFALSIAGNAAMLAVLFKKCRLRSCKSILMINMIFAELTVALTSIPFDFALLQFDQRWVFGSFLCHVLWPVQTASFGALVFTLTAMSIQSYRGIVHPMKKKTSLKATRLSVVAIWAVSFILVLPYGFFLRLVNNECSETWGTIGNELYTVSLFVFHYALPLIIITLCYARIAARIRAEHKQSAKIVSGSQQARLKRSRRHGRAARMVIMFVVVFAVCMLPHHVVWLWITFGKNVRHSDDLLSFAYMFTFTSSFANPLVYFTHNPAFRARLLKIVRCRSHEQETRSKSGSLLGSEDISAESRL